MDVIRKDKEINTVNGKAVLSEKALRVMYHSTVIEIACMYFLIILENITSGRILSIYTYITLDNLCYICMFY